jgi:membrane-bound lytic murein transglycosylase B
MRVGSTGRIGRAGRGVATGVALAALAVVAVGARPQQPAAAATPPSFEDFMAGVRAEAISRGISQATVDLALSDVVPEPVVVARDRRQPEVTQSIDEYAAQRLTRTTTANARLMAKRYASLLRQVEEAYGVPAPLMVSIWGLESNFGKFTGVRPTIAALATLAYDPRRSTLFRNELFSALTILDRKLASITDLKGSWAGAMGQPQFMPSSFLRHAVDFDGDGRIDIWKTEADVFGSMGKYLQAAGWTPGERWGRDVRITKAVMARIDRDVPMRSAGCRAARELSQPRPVNEWRKLGVTLAGGKALPTSEMPASLVRGRARHFLVYKNYEAILDYNCSNAYAVSVGLLADRITN